MSYTVDDINAQCTLTVTDTHLHIHMQTHTCEWERNTTECTAMVTATMTTQNEKYAHTNEQKYSPNGFRFFYILSTLWGPFFILSFFRPFFNVFFSLSLRFFLSVLQFKLLKKFNIKISSCYLQTDHRQSFFSFFRFSFVNCLYFDVCLRVRSCVA